MTQTRNSPQANSKKADNTVIDLPLIGKLSYNEIHASEIGFVIGFITSLLFLYFSTIIAVLTYSIIALTPTLYPKLFDPSAAIYTIQSEPWYYLSCSAIGWILTFIIYAILNL